MDLLHRFFFFISDRLVTGFVARLTLWVSLVEQEYPTLPKHLSSTPVLSGVRVTRSLVLYVCFVDRCLFFYTFSVGHCGICSSSIYGFCLHLWYLQALLHEQLQYDFQEHIYSIYFWNNVAEIFVHKHKTI